MKRTNIGSELAANTVTSSNKKIKQSVIMSDSDAVMDGKATAEGKRLLYVWGPMLHGFLDNCTIISFSFLGVNSALR